MLALLGGSTTNYTQLTLTVRLIMALNIANGKC